MTPQPKSEVVVPREPTEAMIEAATGCKNPIINTERWDDPSIDVREIYRDMIAAAPQPEAAPPAPSADSGGELRALDAACCNFVNGWQDPYEPREQWEAEADRHVAGLRAAWLEARQALAQPAPKEGEGRILPQTEKGS